MTYDDYAEIEPRLAYLRKKVEKAAQLKSSKARYHSWYDRGGFKEQVQCLVGSDRRLDNPVLATKEAFDTVYFTLVKILDF